MLDFATVLRSSPFKVLVGDDKSCFNIPRTLAKDISEPLHALMNNEHMKEAQEGVAILEDVESDVFTAFCEFAYTGTYHVPEVTIEPIRECTPDHPPPEESAKFEDMEARVTPEPWFKDEEPAPALPIEDSKEYGWYPRSKKGKKAKPRSVTPPADLGETDLSRSARLWSEFRDFSRFSITKHFKQEPGDEAIILKEEFKPLLFHVKIYVFAEKYLVQSLKSLCMSRLHSELKAFRLVPVFGDKEFLEALTYTFEHTERREPLNDELRVMMIHYTACEVKKLAENSSFRTLLDSDGELASDLVHKLL